MQKITPCLWFGNNAEEAVNFYTSIFNHSKVGHVARHSKDTAEISGLAVGSALSVEFELIGHKFLALNGGSHFTFTPAISFIVNCPAKDEVDELWSKLIDGGNALMPINEYPFSERYGWLIDKYGVSWQLIYAAGTEEQTIVPSMMFVGDNCGKAEEAITFYVSVFEDSTIGNVAHYGANQFPDKEGTVMYADFTLAGNKFAAMDSAHDHKFTFNEAISFSINCDTKEEVDHYWEKLSAVPEAEQCGWLKDKYGLSWQVVPTALPRMLQDPDKEKAGRVAQEMLQMKKIDIEKLEEVYKM
ncbi:VOC family protein [Anaerobacillus sp. MEB173]|uniref:VOC family protein n=1 Tax=Anaerobacillus sp. MEB173 TaxID=3383345 RepID=UPI003F8EA8B0